MDPNPATPAGATARAEPIQSAERLHGNALAAAGCAYPEPVQPAERRDGETPRASAPGRPSELPARIQANSQRPSARKRECRDQYAVLQSDRLPRRAQPSPSPDRQSFTAAQQAFGSLNAAPTAHPPAAEPNCPRHADISPRPPVDEEGTRLNYWGYGATTSATRAKGISATALRSIGSIEARACSVLTTRRPTQRPSSTASSTRRSMRMIREHPLTGSLPICPPTTRMNQPATLPRTTRIPIPAIRASKPILGALPAAATRCRSAPQHDR